MNPGLVGWLAVGVVVAVADGVALAKQKPTMSDVFHRNQALGIFILGGTAAHLLAHRERDRDAR